MKLHLLGCAVSCAWLLSCGTAAAPNTTNDKPIARELTAMDQGGSPQELGITRNVRQLVMMDDSLSFAAKNVRIVTVGSQVTLLGQVAGERERAAVELYAVRTPGVVSVSDRLQVR